MKIDDSEDIMRDSSKPITTYTDDMERTNSLTNKWIGAKSRFNSLPSIQQNQERLMKLRDNVELMKDKMTNYLLKVLSIKPDSEYGDVVKTYIYDEIDLGVAPLRQFISELIKNQDIFYDMVDMQAYKLKELQSISNNRENKFNNHRKSMKEEEKKRQRREYFIWNQFAQIEETINIWKNSKDLQEAKYIEEKLRLFKEGLDQWEKIRQFQRQMTREMYSTLRVSDNEIKQYYSRVKSSNLSKEDLNKQFQEASSIIQNSFSQYHKKREEYMSSLRRAVSDLHIQNIHPGLTGEVVVQQFDIALSMPSNRSDTTVNNSSEPNRY